MSGFFKIEPIEGWEKSLCPSTDYFDFPSSLVAFSESLKNSYLRIEDNKVFFRQRGRYLTLITYFCTGPELKEIILKLTKQKFKIKTLNFVNKDFTGLDLKFYMNEYWADSDYSIATVMERRNAKRRAKFKNKLKWCDKRFTITSCLKSKDVFELFDIWAQQAQSRHFMVIRGHYKRYLTRYFEDRNNVHLFGFFKKDQLWGVAGFEIFNNLAQITIMKHRIGDNNFPVFFWFETLKRILSYPDRIEKVFCGTTADKLKDYLRLQKARSYKIEIP